MDRTQRTLAGHPLDNPEDTLGATLTVRPPPVTTTPAAHSDTTPTPVPTSMSIQQGELREPTSTNTPPDITLGDTSAVRPLAITAPPDAASTVFTTSPADTPRPLDFAGGKAYAAPTPIASPAPRLSQQQAASGQPTPGLYLFTPPAGSKPRRLQGAVYTLDNLFQYICRDVSDILFILILVPMKRFVWVDENLGFQVEISCDAVEIAPPYRISKRELLGMIKKDGQIDQRGQTNAYYWCWEKNLGRGNGFVIPSMFGGIVLSWTSPLHLSRFINWQKSILDV